MNSILIDTNCLVSYVTDRNPVQQELVAGYIEDPYASGIELFVIENVITEFVYVMHNIYGFSGLNIAETISELLSSPGIFFMEGFNPQLVFELWPTQINNYGDAVLAAFAQVNHIPLLTFDKEFAKELRKNKIDFKLLAV